MRKTPIRDFSAGHVTNDVLLIYRFIVFDYADRYDEASRQVGEWISQGKLKIRETRRYGLTEAVNGKPVRF